MPQRKFYPAPACPDCKRKGPGSSYVKDTVYTEDGFILRFRNCAWCEGKWWTKQSPEMNIDPSKERVVHPPKYKNMPRDMKRTFYLKPLSISNK